MSYLTITVNEKTALIPFTSHTLREQPCWTFRQSPLEGDNPDPHYWGTEITGCVVTRITPGTAEFLLSLIMEEITSENYCPEIGNQWEIHRKRTSWTNPITVTEIIQKERIVYENLVLTGYTLSAYRQSAFSLRLDLEGTMKKRIPLDSQMPVYRNERFSYLNTSPLLNNTSLNTIDYFSLSGEKQDNGEIRETLILRQRDFPSAIAADNSFRLEVTGEKPWLLNIERAVSRLLLPFDTDKERWGWESTFEVWNGSESISREEGPL